ncbi:MAG TPA: DUF4126 domain-containing protein [Gemmatimonadaceae bacterium]|nr:DUF4126 domain-containing protein [Gemmatimonadaceae bacterium]
MPLTPLITLAQSLGLAYASGISPYSTVTLVGLMERAGWIGPLPGVLGALAHPVVLGVAGTLALVEFLATLVPGVASAWETVHTAIRPPAAAALAVATAWHADASVITLAALLGGGLALATHATKLGLRFAVDASPEPVTNAAVNVTELGVVASLSYFVWHHPIAALAVALVLLVATMLAVRLAWRAVRRMLRRVIPRAVQSS